MVQFLSQSGPLTDASWKNWWGRSSWLDITTEWWNPTLAVPSGSGKSTAASLHNHPREDLFPLASSFIYSLSPSLLFSLPFSICLFFPPSLPSFSSLPLPPLLPPSLLSPSLFLCFQFFFISFLLSQLLFVYLFLSEYTQKPIACVPSLYSACVQDASGISLIDEILSIDGSEIFCEIFIYRLQLGLYIEEWGGGSRAILSLSLVSFSLSRKHTHTYTHFNKYKCPQTCQMPV